MLVANRLKPRHFLFYTWHYLLYFGSLSIVAYFLHWEYNFNIPSLTLPFNAVATVSTALAIYLGFKNNQAYDRWWEARKIWGLLVNYSRAFGREVMTFPQPASPEEADEVERWKQQVVRRHIAFVHGLRVFLRKPNGYLPEERELMQPPNTYEDLRPFLSDEEFAQIAQHKNPPNQLIRAQGLALRHALERGWISDYRFVQMSETLTEFNNHQGRAERIKHTPLPRGYTIYARLFVFLHGTLIPFAFVETLGVMNIPLSMTINLIFLSLEQMGRYVEDPFENRVSDVPITAISRTIEENLKEMFRLGELPHKPAPVDGIVF